GPAALAFFVSSRRRHTRSKRDWSSDVCSSDLSRRASALTAILATAGLLFAACGSDSGGSDTVGKADNGVGNGEPAEVCDAPSGRSEERRVGTEQSARGQA